MEVIILAQKGNDRGVDPEGIGFSPRVAGGDTLPVIDIGVASSDMDCCMIVPW